MIYNCQACEQRAGDNDDNTIFVDGMRYHWECFSEDMDERDVIAYREQYGDDERITRWEACHD